MIPTFVATIRRELCSRCPAQCGAYLTGALDHGTASAACPVGRWPALAGNAPALVRLEPKSPALGHLAYPSAWLELYRRAWAGLHQRALRVEGQSDTEWLALFSARLPCGECKQHWREMLHRTPPEWQRYFDWTVDRHNEVNRRLGKLVWTAAAARQRWGGGET